MNAGASAPQAQDEYAFSYQFDGKSTTYQLITGWR